MRKLRIISIIMVLCMLLVPLQIQAAQSETSNKSIVYTALGDSIAAGVTANGGSGYIGEGYVGLLSDALSAKYGEVELNNLAVLGDNSSELQVLLKQLKKDKETRSAVKKSDIITVCIGANNILGPIRDAAVSGMLTDPAAQAPLISSLNAGIAQMASDWRLIISQIRKLAPHAKVYVMNVYNPLIPPTGTPDQLYSLLDYYINGLNSIIDNSSSFNKPFRYEVVDVYSAFLNKGINILSLTGFYVMPPNMPDPHPTVAGHELIFQVHEEAMELD